MTTPPDTITADVGTASVVPGRQPGDDRTRYLDTLRDLGAHGFAVNTALLEAQLADGPKARTGALTDLHHRIRAMAALANHALGGYPDPPDEQEPQ